MIAGVAFAEEKKEELQITVGVKTWYNKWSEKFDTEYGSGKERFVTRKSDHVLAVGPAISLRKDHILAVFHTFRQPLIINLILLTGRVIRSELIMLNPLLAMTLTR